MASPELYCNIGDAYFKQGNYPKAILNYERALKLDPSFSDARYNLDFAQSFTQDKIEAVPEFILESVGRKMCYTMGSDTWAVLFLVFLALTAACVLVFLLASSTGKRRTGFYCGIVFLLLSLLCLEFSAWQKRDYGKKDSAIVMLPVSSVKSSPSGGKDLFVIHEGTKVKILDNVGDWQNIALADGRQGWIESSAIEII
ncbi:MAG: tetratricopeptide repeat protein [Bacteroidales bacterium]|nr:tetratricopeptide repeat protein [Bacteroidales bacterium]